MRESVTYQAILREGYEEGFKEGFKEGFEIGRLEGAMKIIVLVATVRLGDPAPLVLARFKEIAAYHRLERICDHVFDSKSWEELLQTP